MSNDPRDPRDAFDDYDEFEDEAEPVTGRRYPNPPRPDPPLFAPVVFGDEEEDERPRRPFRAGRDESDGEYASDTGLLRVLGIIVVLGLVIIALVIPWSPFSVVGGDDGDTGQDGITAEARDDLPPVPEGLVALSRLYDITVDEGIAGPLRVQVRLTESTTDAANLAYYGWDGSQWSRIGSVDIQDGGNAVSGTIPAADGSIAVLRRTSLAYTLGLIVEAGEAPDPKGLASADTVAVMNGIVAGVDSEDSSLEIVQEGGLRQASTAAGDKPVLLGVTGDLGERDILASAEAMDAHVADLLAAARDEEADGLLIDYPLVQSGERTQFVDLVTRLSEEARAGSLRLIVVVPVEGDGYDWAGLQGVADALWVRAPLEPQAYYDAVETLADSPAMQEVDASRVSLILDRRSTMTAGSGAPQAITLVQALTAASTVDYNVDEILPDFPVTLRTAFLGGGIDGLHWDESLNAVTFSYSDNNTPHRVTIQNAYSLAFQLSAASQGGFGGIAIAGAGATASHPDVWEPVAQFIGEGTVTLLRPYGPYLTPCWQATDGDIEGQGECWTEETDASAVVWRAPREEGAYTVRLVVSDGTTFVAQEIALRVGEGEEEPTPEATDEPIEEPTAEATEPPTEVPTEEPTAEATETPTEEPTAEPTVEPTEEPTAEATEPPGPGGN